MVLSHGLIEADQDRYRRRACTRSSVVLSHGHIEASRPARTDSRPARSSVVLGHGLIEAFAYRRVPQCTVRFPRPSAAASLKRFSERNTSAN